MSGQEPESWLKVNKPINLTGVPRKMGSPTGSASRSPGPASTSRALSPTTVPDGPDRKRSSSNPFMMEAQPDNAGLTQGLIVNVRVDIVSSHSERDKSPTHQSSNSSSAMDTAHDYSDGPGSPNRNRNS